MKRTQTSAPPRSIEVTEGLRGIVVNYDLILVDMWGTIYDRDVGLYRDAADTLCRARADGRKIFLTSNAARPAALEVGRQLGDSLPPDGYDAVITAGEVLRRLLVCGKAGIPNSSRNYFLLGHARNAGLLTGDGYNEVGQLSDADFVVVAGLGGGDESSQIGDSSWRATDEILTRALAAGLPLLACKTDWLTVRGDGRPWIGPGPFMSRYKAQGGTVHMVGKPAAAYYRHCLELAGVDARRTLAIGDHIETDIMGAAALGIDSMLIRGGLLDRLTHPDPFDGEPEFSTARCLAANAAPTFEMANLRW
jgi:HAD superfamily hydrolase (TIGR01459 family)